MSATLDLLSETQNPKRRAIMVAAAELFMAEGYAAVSMDAVARTAAVSKGMCRLHYQAAWRAARGQAVRPKRPTKPRPKAKRKPKPKPASTLPNGWFKPSLKPVPPKPEAGAIDTVSLIAPVLDDATLAAARANVIAAGGTDLLAMLGLDEVAA